MLTSHANRTGMILVLGWCLAANVVQAQEAKPPYPSFLDPSASEGIGPQNELVDAARYQRVFYVTPDGSDETGDGSREKPWATPAGALAKIPPATPADRPCAVLVSAGRYLVKDMPLEPHVHLYGGFDPSSWERDISAHETILDAEGAGRVAIGADDARLDGFIITGGRFRGHGGAILCDDTSPQITNNVFRGNTTLAPADFRHDRVHQAGHDGGAIAVFYKGGPRIANNLFFGNRTEVGGGAAISCQGEQRLQGGPIALITKNVFIDNVSGVGDKTPTRSSNGGAIHCTRRAPARIVHNVFVRNRAEGLGDGGALYIERDAAPFVAGNWFIGNRCGDDGGAIYAFKNCLPFITGNYFAGNDALRGGPGGIRLSHQGAALIHNNVIAHNFKGGIDCASAWMRFSHNTVAHNHGFGVGYRSHGGEGYEGKPVYFAPADINHNIIYGNRGQSIQASRAYYMPEPVVQHNLVQGGYPGTGNFDADPAFVADGFGGRFTDARFDDERQTTVLTVRERQDDRLQTVALPGRVIQVGGQYGVVRSNDGARIAVWGDMTRPLPPTETPEPGRTYPQPETTLDENEFQLLPTYQLKPDSPAQGYGATTTAPPGPEAAEAMEKQDKSTDRRPERQRAEPTARRRPGSAR